MPNGDRILGIYLHLARASSARRQLKVRDKMLVLAGVKAHEMDLSPIADLCRHKVLANNPQHLLRQWPSFAAALDDDTFLTFLKQLIRRYSPEKAEHMLASLGIEMGNEREAYYSDLEYAAALLDTRPEDIDSLISQSQTAAVRSPAQVTNSSNAKAYSAPAEDLLAVWGPWLVGVSILACLAVAAFLRNG